MLITVISCVQRTGDRAVTIPQLEAHGRVFVSLSPCSPAGPAGNAAASKVALLEARRYSEGGVLFCEDDIDISPSFGWFLQQAQERGVVTWFYTHDSPNSLRSRFGGEVSRAIMNGDPVPAGLYAAPFPLTGSQCVYIPPDVLALLPLDELKDGPCDFFLNSRLVRLGVQGYVALPHPVQHRHSRVARVPDGGVMKRSLSYGLWGGVA